MQHSIEYKEYLNFRKSYYSIKNNPQRIGQAFVEYFKLDKSTQLKEISDKLYQLDGFPAVAFIQTHFVFN